jgi:hypothetical protein
VGEHLSFALLQRDVEDLIRKLLAEINKRRLTDAVPDVFARDSEVRRQHAVITSHAERERDVYTAA